MIGQCVELLVNLPGQSKGNIGEVVRHFHNVLALEMADGSHILVMAGDVKPL